MTSSTVDPYHLERFVQAQQQAYAAALSEVKDGRKRSHWMWYIFPQIKGLGTSPISQLYAIQDASEAKAYLHHPVLGPRLLEITDALLNVDGRTAREIFGTPDDLKLKSCATLFASISPPDSVFEKVLTKYFNAEPDAETLRRLRRSS
jgi:uncharacterized protein (DUF1810 family)